MYEEILFISRRDFRKWLIKNHNTFDGAWLIFGKTDALKTISPHEALEEAICFGWIDGQIKRVDDDRYIKKFTPRRKKSNWSQRNMKVVAELVEKDKMTEHGLKVIERAQKEGTWDAADAKPISEEEIKVLIKALGDTQPALNNFLNMSSSIKRTYTALYITAKKEETKVRRLKKIIERLNENKKPM